MDQHTDQSGERDAPEARASDPESGSDSSEQQKTVDETVDDVKPRWQHRDRFPIQDRMVDVVKLTKKVAEGEVAKLRRQLEKLQYGG